MPGARRLSVPHPLTECQARRLWKLGNLVWGSSVFVLLQKEKECAGYLERREQRVLDTESKQ